MTRTPGRAINYCLPVDSSNSTEGGIINNLSGRLIIYLWTSRTTQKVEKLTTAYLSASKNRTIGRLINNLPAAFKSHTTGRQSNHCLPVSLQEIYHFIYQFTYLSTYSPIHLYTHLSTHPPVPLYLSVYLPVSISSPFFMRTRINS